MKEEKSIKKRTKKNLKSRNKISFRLRLISLKRKVGEGGGLFINKYKTYRKNIKMTEIKSIRKGAKRLMLGFLFSFLIFK